MARNVFAYKVDGVRELHHDNYPDSSGCVTHRKVAVRRPRHRGLCLWQGRFVWRGQRPFARIAKHYKCHHSSVVEHDHGKVGVRGSNPRDGSIFNVRTILFSNYANLLCSK